MNDNIKEKNQSTNLINDNELTIKSKIKYGVFFLIYFFILTLPSLPRKITINYIVIFFLLLIFWIYYLLYLKNKVKNNFYKKIYISIGYTILFSYSLFYIFSIIFSKQIADCYPIFMDNNVFEACSGNKRLFIRNANDFLRSSIFSLSLLPISSFLLLLKNKRVKISFDNFKYTQIMIILRLLLATYLLGLLLTIIKDIL